MSDVNILAQVIDPSLIATGLMCSSAANKTVITSNYRAEGEEWLVPVVDAGVFARYEEVQQIMTLPAPTTDSIRVVRLRDPFTGEMRYVLGTQADWLTAANACCGATPNMPDVVIVDPIVEEMPCPVSIPTLGTPTYFYVDVAPVLTAGQRYLISGSANGVAFTPAASGAGYATLAAALAFAQASWGAYGTWSISTDGDGLQLSSTTTKTGSVKVAVLPAP